MNRLGVFLLLILTGILLAFGCGEDKSSPVSPGKPDSGNSGESGEITFQVSYAPWKPLAAKAAAVEKIDRATAFVFDREENDIFKEDLDISEGRASGKLVVQAQDSLRVALVFYDGDIVRYIGDNPNVNVPARGTVEAKIVEQYMGTTIIAPDSAYVGQEYRITWMKRPFATWYEVEESTNPDFVDAGTVYSGEDTTFVMEPKYEGEAKLTFYYRARVYTDYGWGPWHGQGKTGIAGIEGTIIIDVPVPPDVPGGESAIDLTSPNGGEVWAAGSTHSITWTSSGVNLLNIEFSKDLGMTWTPIASNVSAVTGSFSWRLPDEQLPSCLLRVRDAADAAIFSQSDGVFSILKTALTLTTPNGGERLKAKEITTISWSSTGIDKISIELSTDSGSTWTPVAASVSASTGAYLWQVPESVSQNCLLRIRDTASSLNDVSDAVFDIIAADVRRITLVAPNGGEVLRWYSSCTVRWDASFGDMVDIEYSSDNGKTWKWQGKTSGSLGSFLWTVPVVTSSQCLLRVTDSTSLLVTDQSDAVFSIAAPVGVVTVTAPNGGESFTGGDLRNITWTSTAVDSVRIDFSTDNGATWQIVENGLRASDRAYYWKTPDVSSTNCLVRVSNYRDFSIMDVSDATFTVREKESTAPRITVTSPNGGESWTAGSTQAITWTSYNAGSMVNIDFSPDNGATWSRLATDTSLYSGSYSWKLPSLVSSRCLVRVSSADNSQAIDQSNAPFSITSAGASLTVVSPNGREEYVPGSTIEVAWMSLGVSTVKIEYLSGSNWYPVTAGVAASTGKYSWTLPSSEMVSKIRVADSSNPAINDESDNYFTVTNTQTSSLRLTSPIGGERWAAGTVRNITWTSAGVNAIDIYYELFTGTGSSQVKIASAVNAGTGSYAWTVPVMPLGYSRVKVVSTALAPAFTGAAFSVPNVRLVQPNGGESLVVGSAKKITWDCTGITKVNLDYSTDNGASWQSIASNVWADTKAYTWSVPFTRSSQCLVRISDMETPDATDKSDAPFTIANSITVSQPDGRESWVEGNTRYVTWTRTGVDKVNIEFTKDNGATWTTIAANVDAALGSYAVTVPNIASSSCQFRLTDAQYPNVVGRSRMFSIRNTHGTIHLSAPNGGESYAAGDWAPLEWTVTGFSMARIELSTDGGRTWTTLNTRVPVNTLSFSQWLPRDITSANCLFRVSDQEDESVNDSNDAPFAITGGTAAKPAGRK